MDAHLLWHHQQNKISHLLFSFLVRIIIVDIIAKKILEHHFHWLHKCFSPRNQNHCMAFIRSIKFHCVQYVRHVMFSMLFRHLPQIISKQAIHYSLVSNEWVLFWPELMKFLVVMLNHTHWLRVPNHASECLVCSVIFETDHTLSRWSRDWLLPLTVRPLSSQFWTKVSGPLVNTIC